MHDHAAAACGTDHRVAIQRIAAHPHDAVALHDLGIEPALERTHLPACIAQLPRDFPANPAARTEHQYLPVRHACIRRHRRSP